MLQQHSSHVSSVCGHSHFKKIWLLQTQNENQVCEDRNDYSDGKRSLLSSETSLNRTCAPATNFPVRSLVACSSYNVSPSSTARRASLVNCVESLSPPLSRSRPSSPTSMSPNPNVEDEIVPDNTGVGVPSKSLRTCSSFVSQSCSLGGPLVLPRSLDPLVSPHPLDQGESIKQTLLVDNQSFSYSSGHDRSSLHEERYQANGITCCNRMPYNQVDVLKQKFYEAQPSPDVQVGSVSFSSDSSSHTEVSTRNKFTGQGDRQNGSILKGFHQIQSKGNRKCSPPPVINGDLQGSYLRACSTCGTTRTPLWRTGPHGPKSLCNACGIRYKKAKRSVQGEISPLASSGNAKFKGRSLKRKQDMMFGPDLVWSRSSNSKVAHPVSTCQPQPVKHSSWAYSRLKINTPRESINCVSPVALVKDNCHNWKFGSPSAIFTSKVSKSGVSEKLIGVNRASAKDDEEAAFLLMYLSSGLIYA